jgi:RHS repeat-associated protein
VLNKPVRITDPRQPRRPGHDAHLDPSGNPATVIADVGNAPHLNAQTRFTYTGLGQVASTIDPNGVLTRNQYDGFGNLLARIADANGLARTTIYTYNTRGDVLSVADPKGNLTTNTYDDARRLLTSTSPPTAAAINGVLTSDSYDADGRLLQVRQLANGTVLRSASTTYTPSGKVATTTDANSNVTRNAYDPLERLSSVTDAEGRTVRYGYDAVSRPTTVSNLAIQANPLVTQSYTADSKLASLADANGNSTAFAYDGFDRLATTTYPGGTTETFTYDAVDNPLTRKNRAGGSFSFTYDTLNRLASKTPPASGPVVSYGYDLLGRPTAIGDNSATMTAAVPPGGTPVAYTTTYAYDALNRPLNATWNNAPAVTAPAAGTLVSFGHSYNKVNQRVGQTISDNTWLAYPSGAPSTTSYTANTLNQYTAVTGLTPSYDSNGNLTGDGTYTFGYDPENRLTSASGAGNSSTYAFDAQGRRKSRTINGTTTISVTDADNREVLEYDGSTGALLRWYAYGLGPNDVFNQMNVAGSTRTTYAPDILGSVIATFDATGTLTKSAYQPYGASAAAATPFGFTGQRIDTETGGNYYYRARHYSTVLGRFLQADPIGYIGGRNLYAYGGNDPLNGVDATGLATDVPSTDWGSGGNTSSGGWSPSISDLGSNGPGSPSVGSEGAPSTPSAPASSPGNAAPIATGIPPPQQAPQAAPISPVAFTPTPQPSLGGPQPGLGGQATLSPITQTSLPNNFAPSAPLNAPSGNIQFAGTPSTGLPNSWVVNPGSGQMRLFGPNGLPILDIDFDHDHGSGSPHIHIWLPSPGGFPVRGPAVPYPSTF